MSNPVRLSPRGRAALAYLRERRRVFPLCEPTPHQHKRDEKLVDCDDPGKVPLVKWKGFQERAPTEAEVIRWWRRWPNANIAEVLGRGRGRLDVDPRNGGDETLARLERAHGAIAETVRILTGGGGEHIELSYDGHLQSRSAIAPGLDWKADGGYAILPDSVHASGRPYQWEAASHPDDVPVAPAPAWLLALISAPDRGGSDRPTINLELVLDGIPEGERDETLYRFACRMRADDVPIEYAVLLARQAARLCRPAFDEDRAAEKVSRAYSNFEPTPQLRLNPTPSGGDGAEGCITCGAPRDWRPRLAVCEAQAGVIRAERERAARAERLRSADHRLRLAEQRLERVTGWSKTDKALIKAVAAEAVSAWSRGVDAAPVYNTVVAERIRGRASYVGERASALFDRPEGPVIRERVTVPREDGSGLGKNVILYRWNADGEPTADRFIEAMAELGEALPERRKPDPRRCDKHPDAARRVVEETSCEECGKRLELRVTRRKPPSTVFPEMGVPVASHTEGGTDTLPTVFPEMVDDDARAAAMVAIPIAARNGANGQTGGNGHAPRLPGTWLEWTVLGDAAPRCGRCEQPLYAAAGDGPESCSGCSTPPVATGVAV